MSDDELMIQLRPDIVSIASWLGTVNNFLADQDLDWLSFKYRNGSPWVEFTCWVHMKGEYVFALWRATGAIHQVGPDGAVFDEPLTEFPATNYPRQGGMI